MILKADTEFLPPDQKSRILNSPRNPILSFVSRTLIPNFEIRIQLHKASRTNPMAELRVRTLPNKRFDLFPISSIVTDVLALRADRQQPAQRFHIRQRHLQLGNQPFPLSLPLLPFGNIAEKDRYTVADRKSTRLNS